MTEANPILARAYAHTTKKNSVNVSNVSIQEGDIEEQIEKRVYKPPNRSQSQCHKPIRTNLSYVSSTTTSTVNNKNIEYVIEEEEQRGGKECVSPYRIEKALNMNANNRNKDVSEERQLMRNISNTNISSLSSNSYINNNKKISQQGQPSQYNLHNQFITNNSSRLSINSQKVPGTNLNASNVSVLPSKNHIINNLLESNHPPNGGFLINSKNTANNEPYSTKTFVPKHRTNSITNSYNTPTKNISTLINQVKNGGINQLSKINMNYTQNQFQTNQYQTKPNNQYQTNNNQNQNYNANFKNQYTTNYNSQYDTNLGQNNKKECLVNLEDFMLIEEKLCEIIDNLKTNRQNINDCFDWWNFYFNCSLSGNFDVYFKEESAKIIVRDYQNLELITMILTYDASHDKDTLKSVVLILKSIFVLLHENLLFICEYILSKVSYESLTNVWVHKLKGLVKSKLNNKTKSKDHAAEIRENNRDITDYLRIILKNYPSNEKIDQLISMFKNLNKINKNILNEFFRNKIIRLVNKNASVLASQLQESEILQLQKNNRIMYPYLRKEALKEYTLVLDLDETLIHFQVDGLDEQKGLLRMRPGLFEFLESVSRHYELVVFTAATQDVYYKILNF